jgi:hypothetical protein
MTKWGWFVKGLCGYVMSENLKLLKHSYPNTGAWVLENGFSIETGGWDLICNPFSIS